MSYVSIYMQPPFSIIYTRYGTIEAAACTHIKMIYSFAYVNLEIKKIRSYKSLLTIRVYSFDYILQLWGYVHVA